MPSAMHREEAISDMFYGLLFGFMALTGSMTQGQFINDKEVLLKAAKEAGVEGAQHLLDTEDELKSEVSKALLAVYNAQYCCCACSSCICASMDQAVLLHLLSLR